MYKQLEKKIRAWAEKEPLVQALVVIGSHARLDHPADRWSDLDLLLFVFDQQPLIRDDAWLIRFGDVWLSSLQSTGLGYPEWFVIYDGGLKVDFLLVEGSDSYSETLYGPHFGVVARRGVRVLVDKGEHELSRPIAQTIGQPLPEMQAFTRAVELYWVSAFRAASLLRRGDLWRARKIMDVTLRQQIVEMMTWHAQANNDPGLDTWYEGRHLEEWADTRALSRLPALFAPYEIASSARTLGEMLSLYAWLVEETAVHLKHALPSDLQVRVRDWIESELRNIV